MLPIRSKAVKIIWWSILIQCVLATSNIISFSNTSVATSLQSLSTPINLAWSHSDSVILKPSSDASAPQHDSTSPNSFILATSSMWSTQNTIASTNDQIHQTSSSLTVTKTDKTHIDASQPQNSFQLDTEHSLSAHYSNATMVSLRQDTSSTVQPIAKNSSILLDTMNHTIADQISVIVSTSGLTQYNLSHSSSMGHAKSISSVGWAWMASEAAGCSITTYPENLTVVTRTFNPGCKPLDVDYDVADIWENYDYSDRCLAAWCLVSRLIDAALYTGTMTERITTSFEVMDVRSIPVYKSILTASNEDPVSYWQISYGTLRTVVRTCMCSFL